MMNTEKDLAKLLEKISNQDFKSSEELNDFMSQLVGQSPDDLPKRTDKKSRAQDLVYEAHEQSVSKGKKLVKQALELDPDNVDAYNYLADAEKDIYKAIGLYEKAITTAEKILGEKFFKEHKGYFWGVFETRPYMRAKDGLAACFHSINEEDKAIAIYEEMLELNPRDNQGIRYLLSTLFLAKKDLPKFEKFIKNSEDEDCAVWNFNNALYSFMKFGPKLKSEKVLLEAYKSNEFVIDYLLGDIKLPKERPQYVTYGGESEAVSYVNTAWPIWNSVEGAFDWIYNFKQKRVRMN